MTTETETVPAAPPAQQRHYGRAALGGAIAGLLALGIYIAADQHQHRTAPDDVTVAHTVTLDGGSPVVVKPGEALPGQVVTALRDPHQAFDVALRLERVTGSHVLLVQPHGTGQYASIDPLASGTGVVVADTPVADLALQEAHGYVTAHSTAPDGFPWQVVDLTE